MDENSLEAAPDRIEARAQTAAPPAGFSPRRVVLTALGLLFLGLAILGSILPVLPTTPFVLVAAALFSRSSPTLNRRIRESRLFGPTIRAWQETGSISTPTKIVALAMLWSAITISIVFAVESRAGEIALVLCAALVSLFILSRPAR